MPKHPNHYGILEFFNDCLQRQEGLSPEEAPQFVHLDPHKLFEFGVPNDNFNVDDAVSNLLKLPHLMVKKR